MRSLRFLRTQLVALTAIVLLPHSPAIAVEEPPALSQSPVPAIISPPTAQTVVAGTTATLSVLTNSAELGDVVFSFQWYRGALALPGETNAWIEFDSVQFTDAGLYRVVVSSDSGSSVTSPAARLTVTVPPPAAPEFPSPLRVGEAVSTSIAVPGPAITGLVYKANGLPAGLRLDPQTGDLYGAVHVAGVHRFSYWAQYRSLKSVVASVTLNVEPFPAQYAGAYEMLLDGANYPAPGGKVNLRVSATGVFTGTLRATALTAALPVKGRLGFLTGENFVSGLISLPRGKDKLAREFELSIEENRASAALLIGGSHVATGSQGPRLKSYSAGVAEPAAGRYTVAFASPENLGNRSAPDGAGYATATISATGLLKLTGKLPDGTPLTGTAPRLENGSYLSFSKPLARAGSGLGGVLALETDDYEESASSRHRARSRFYWVRPAVPGKVYPEGFGAIRFAVAMERWTPPTQTLSLYELLEYPEGAVFNLQLSFIPWDGENLPGTLTINSRGAIVVADSANPSGFTITLNSETGFFSGKYRALDENGGTDKVAFRGVLLQLPAWETDFTLAQGYYLHSVDWDPGMVYSARIEFGSL